jgi:hypothetical protein
VFDVDTLACCAAVRMLSVPSGPVGMPEQPTTPNETAITNVLTRIKINLASASPD